MGFDRVKMQRPTMKARASSAPPASFTPCLATSQGRDTRPLLTSMEARVDPRGRETNP
jgi:hypothetical protein